MGLFDNWPYSDVHQLNLDWILKVIKEVKEKLDLIDQTVSDLEGYVNSCSDSADLAEGYKNQADGYQQDAKGYRDGAADWYDQTVALLAGSPKVVDHVADMTDTDLIYVYVGSEAGYTAGNWYYYDNGSWVSGGTYGATGMDDNARNLLKYILDRVAYTETGMGFYVEALYNALEQIQHVVTTYSITNALSHITNSNDATGINAGVSYSGTLTAETGYDIDQVLITMGGIDVTSSAYNNLTGEITIGNASGDIVITASAISQRHLPAEYQEVEYIQGSGTQYINTGITLTNGSVRMKAKVEAKATSSQNMTILGVRTGTGVGQMAVSLTASSSLSSTGMSTGNNNNNMVCTTYGWLNTVKDVVVEIDGLLSAGNSNSASMSASFATSDDTFNVSKTGNSADNTIGNVGIFSGTYNDNNMRYRGRIYYAQLWNDGVLLLDVVPCYRILDSVIGMYDFVSDTFLTNDGSGVFTKGSDVV